MFTIEPSSGDPSLVESLLDRAFGPNRQAKTSYRYREGPPIPDLSLVAERDGVLVGTIAFWPVEVGETGKPVALLGPLGVEPALQGQGIGAALVRRGLERAGDLGWEAVFLVGRIEYYGPFGFSRDTHPGVTMPDEDPSRLLSLELKPGALASLSGPLLPVPFLPRASVLRSTL